MSLLLPGENVPGHKFPGMEVPESESSRECKSSIDGTFTSGSESTSE